MDFRFVVDLICVWKLRPDLFEYMFRSVMILNRCHFSWVIRYNKMMNI